MNIATEATENTEKSLCPLRSLCALWLIVFISLARFSYLGATRRRDTSDRLHRSCSPPRVCSNQPTRQELSVANRTPLADGQVVRHAEAFDWRRASRSNAPILRGFESSAIARSNPAGWRRRLFRRWSATGGKRRARRRGRLIATKLLRACRGSTANPIAVAYWPCPAPPAIAACRAQGSVSRFLPGSGLSCTVARRASSDRWRGEV